MLDNRYFDMLKDLIEDFLANGSPSVDEATLVISLIRKVAKSDKTEYSAKLLEIVQDVLGLLAQKQIESMMREEMRLLEMCIGVLTDMVENQVLQFFLTLQIIKRKFPDLIEALMDRVKNQQYSFGFVDFLATVRSELYELNLDECFFAFS